MTSSQLNEQKSGVKQGGQRTKRQERKAVLAPLTSLSEVSKLFAQKVWHRHIENGIVRDNLTGSFLPPPAPDFFRIRSHWSSSALLVSRIQYTAFEETDCE